MYNVHVIIIKSAVIMSHQYREQNQQLFPLVASYQILMHVKVINLMVKTKQSYRVINVGSLLHHSGI